MTSISEILREAGDLGATPVEVAWALYGRDYPQHVAMVRKACLDLCGQWVVEPWGFRNSERVWRWVS